MVVTDPQNKVKHRMCVNMVWTRAFGMKLRVRIKPCNTEAPLRSVWTGNPAMMPAKSIRHIDAERAWNRRS